MGKWSATDICGVQVDPVDCDDGAVVAGSTVLTCALYEFSRSAVLTDGLNEVDPLGKANKYAARRVEDPVPDYWTYSFTLTSKTDAEFMGLLGLVEVIYDDVDPLIVVGVADLDQVIAEDDCCPSGGGSCTDDEVSMLIWSLAWCGESRHPDFLFNIHVVPRIGFRTTTDSVERGTGFRTQTVEGRTTRPKTNYGRGPGDLLPDQPAFQRRQWIDLLSNTPYPDGCDCDQCT